MSLSSTRGAPRVLHTNESWWHQWNQCDSGLCDSTQPSAGMSQVGQCCKQTFSPGTCTHFFLSFFFMFLIFVLLIISLSNGIVRCYYLPAKHTYHTVLLLPCKLCESKNLFNIFSCKQIHYFLNWDWSLAFSIENTERWRHMRRLLW